MLETATDSALLRMLGINNRRTLSAVLDRVHEGTDTPDGALLEAARRLARLARPNRAEVRTFAQVAAILADAPLYGCERLWCLPLDAHSRLIGEPVMVSLGDVDGTDAGPRSFFRVALAAGATTCIAAHNHPTGDATPSAADLTVTRRLVSAGRTIDIALVDHVVLGAGAAVSIRAQNPGLFC